MSEGITCCGGSEKTPQKPAPARGRLSRIFAGAAPGVLAGALGAHAGCVLSVAATALGTSVAATGRLSFLFSLAATGTGLALWGWRRGRRAGSLEKKLVAGGALAGLAFSAVLNFGGVRKTGTDGMPADCPIHPGMKITTSGAPAR